MSTGWALVIRHPGDFPPGAQIGSYRVVRQIGRGGMGSVYLAERADGEIQQQVAIKVLRADGHRALGRDRFLRERQLLASMHHPAIVHVLDAGHTPEGRPYLVMEYVEGVPVDVFAAGIGVLARLRLFLKICEGVSHAHRRLIIHRDLKPSNILVDASGMPKLLDFGIGKLLGEPAELTQTIDRRFTPMYASPEQLRGEPQGTATDIYSLGAVLYHLLTGAAPTREWVPPSRIERAVPEDLDYIVAKALRPEPEERYVSVDEFASDVRSALAWQPVRARTGNPWYRARRLLRRHWVAAAAGALALASLTVGLGVANHERNVAQRRYREVRQLANELFDIDVEVRRIPGSTKTRQLIVDTALDYLRRIAGDAGSDPGLALEVGSAYWSVARVQGVPASSNLGQMDQAEKNLNIAAGLFQQVLERQPGNRRALFRLAQVAQDRMLLARVQQNEPAALAYAREARTYLERFGARESDRADVYAILHVQVSIAEQFGIAHQTEESIAACRRGLQMARVLHEESYGGNFATVMAEALRSQGKLEEALAAAREAHRLLASNTVPNPRALNINNALTMEGKILAENNAPNLGRPDEALPLFEQAFANVDRLVHRDPNDSQSRAYLADAGLGLADVLRKSDPRRSLEIYDHTLGHLAEVKNNPVFRRYELSLLTSSTYVLRQLGRAGESRARIDAAFERLSAQKMYPAKVIDLASEAEDTLRAQADDEAAAGRIPHAIQLYEQLLELTRQSTLSAETDLQGAVRLSTLLRNLGELQRRAGRPEAAATLQRDAELWARWDSRSKSGYAREQLEASARPR